MLTSLNRDNYSSLRFQALSMNLHNLASEHEPAAEICNLIALFLTDQDSIAWSYIKRRIRTPFKKTYRPCNMFESVDLYPLKDSVELNIEGHEC